MRILFVHSGADLYGASRSLLRLSSRLVRDGHVVSVVLPYRGPLLPVLEQRGVEVAVCHRLAVITRTRFRELGGLARFLFDIVVSTFWLIRRINAFRPDLVHTNTAVVLASPVAAKLRRVPHVWHVREFFKEFRGLWRWYQRMMLFLSDRLVCVSQAVADQFTYLSERSRLVVLHNGFPRDEYESVSSDRIARFATTYGVTGKVVVGVVGRIKCGRKGQDVFLRAAALLKDDFPNAVFVLIGSPFPGNEAHLKEVQHIVQILRLEDRVVYTGDVDDIKAAYAALDVSVLPSALPEPFGGVVIESMALGKPVVGTNVGGTPEQIEEGVTGFLVEPNDATSLTAAIRQLLADSDLRRRMGAAGRRLYLDRFEFEHFYETILQLYHDVINASGKTHCPALPAAPGAVMTSTRG